MKWLGWIAAAAVLAVMAMAASGGDLHGAEQEGRMLRHLVMYKFRDDCTPAQVQKVIDTFAALPQKIDAIAAFEHGKNVSEEGKSEGLTYCFQVSFRDQQALQTYLKHPAHLEYVKVANPCREKVVVFDYWTSAKD